MRGQRHKLNMGVSHFFYIGNQLARQLTVPGLPAAVSQSLLP